MTCTTRYFAVLVVGSVIAITMPPLVLFGLFFGIVPGLLLMACPSLLFYSLLWFGTRALMRRPFRWCLELIGKSSVGRVARSALGLTAFAFVLAVGVALPKAVNRPIEQAATAARDGDHEPSEPITLPDSVVLVLPEHRSIGGESLCETICQRLLYNAAARRVPVERRPTDQDGPPGWLSYRIEHRERCPELRFVGDIVFAGDNRDDGLGVRGGASRRVRTRIEAGECLIETPAAADPSSGTLVLRELVHGASRFDHPWSLILDTVSARRLEFIDAEGHIAFRRTEVVSAPLLVPLAFMTEAGIFTTVSYAGFARITRTEAPLGPSARDVLPAWLGRSVRNPAGPSRGP